MAALVAELVEGEAVPSCRSCGTSLRACGSGKSGNERGTCSASKTPGRTWAKSRSAQVRHGGLPEDRLLAAAGQARRAQGTLDQLPALPTDSDPTLVVGWAGWNHLEQATALVAYYDARKREGWDAKRLTPLLAGLDQLLPWIHQWHPEIDKEFGETAGQSFQTMLEHDAHELGLTLEDIRNWEPPATTARRIGWNEPTAVAS